jgi:hypothetical protein
MTDLHWPFGPDYRRELIVLMSRRALEASEKLDNTVILSPHFGRRTCKFRSLSSGTNKLVILSPYFRRRILL